MKPLSNASLEAKKSDGEEEGSLVLSLVSCLASCYYGRTNRYRSGSLSMLVGLLTRLLTRLLTLRGFPNSSNLVLFVCL